MVSEKARLNISFGDDFWEFACKIVEFEFDGLSHEVGYFEFLW